MNIGTIIQWGSNTIPDNWLLCDGSAVSRTTYADLFAVIGTNFGSGDGSTTFNLPDLRGRVPVGKSSETEFDTLGETGGEKTHTLTIAEMPSHKHDTLNIALAVEGGPISVPSTVSPSTYLAPTSNTGGGQAHNILQPYVVTNYIIKATQPDSIKISELESATSVTSSDVLPIVQSGETKKMNILNMIYPVGSIYISILDTNPATYFGGVWQPFGQGRTLVGLNTQDEDFDTLLKAGGEKTHTLTIAEMPSHQHKLSLDGYGQDNASAVKWASGNQQGKYAYGQDMIEPVGGGQAHNIMQPYIVVSMWLRIG